ncbi:hypothetical protein TNCV_2941031 [Trichonephila clavipes]|nr:hypothetical protein TNCV_2941031 [Trichonephila clavipes]
MAPWPRAPVIPQLVDRKTFRDNRWVRHLSLTSWYLENLSFKNTSDFSAKHFAPWLVLVLRDEVFLLRFLLFVILFFPQRTIRLFRCRGSETIKTRSRRFKEKHVAQWLEYSFSEWDCVSQWTAIHYEGKM